MSTQFKVTYSTLSADNEALNSMLDESIEEARQRMGAAHPLYIGGLARIASKHIDSINPADTEELVARVGSAKPEEVLEAIRLAKEAYPAWRDTPWRERCAIVEKAAGLIRSRKGELTAWLILENGKNRIEALGEIEETADLYDYYVEQMRANDGFIKGMGNLSPNDTNESVLRPYGVWAVIAPWNFPYALLGAPMAAALLAGNTVVAKPSSEMPLSGVKLIEIFIEAGMPPGVVSLIPGSGRELSDLLVENPDIAGMTFTGSYEIGFSIYSGFSRKYPKPCIVEMGGKNPAIVMPSADLDKAVQGVYRSAFGMGGQKCSACSRVFVHKDVVDEFHKRLARMADETVIDNPLQQTTFLGPMGTKNGYNDYKNFVAAARESGTILSGGETITDGSLARGFYVRPTLVADLPADHWLLREELFVPILCSQVIESIEEGIARANDTEFGLTAGLFSQDESEVEKFLNQIEAGVIYINRAAGATTGAWPGVQPFGGWKGSGSTGKNIGGLYTVQCYMREQSRTITKQND
ncbi:MAG: aldehyde dehydrogenase family protein [Cyanobacteria bacterium]|nr:aldehyde dehydrogenase family protein [Cyanobacteriota bacterium]